MVDIFRTGILVAALGVPGLAGCTGSSDTVAPPVPRVSASTLYTWLSAGKRVVCLDNRPDSLYDAGRISSSIRAHGKAVKELGAVLPIDPDIPIVVIEEPGTPDRESLARKLIDHGSPRVLLLEGGVAAWRSEGHQLDGYRRVP